MTVPQQSIRPRFVDPAELICPGCGEQVCPQPPVYVGAATRPGTAQFSHRDGTALCVGADGTRCEPVEIEALS